MKKFVKSIEICPDNIWDVLNCPIVTGIRKETGCIYEAGRGNPYAVYTELYIDVPGFKLPFGFGFGDVFALDVCGTWYAFTRKEWDEHKNDEI